MRKRLSNNEKTREYLDKLPKIYAVCCWAKWGVLSLPFTGKFKYDKYVNEYVPVVYDYDDHNGTEDGYYLRLLTQVTIGQILTWTMNKDRAYLLADKFEYARRSEQEFEKFRKERNYKND